MKPTDNPIQRHRFTLTFDLLFEDVTAEAVKRWNQHTPPHMQIPLDTWEIDFYHRLLQELIHSPKLHDWIVGWLEADAQDLIYQAIMRGFDSDGDPHGQIEQDLVQRIIREAPEGDSLLAGLELEPNDERLEDFETDSSFTLNFFQWRPVFLTERVFNAVDELISKANIDLTGLEGDWGWG